MNRALISIKTIGLLSALSLVFLFHPQNTQAFTPADLDSVTDGSKLYTYNTQCPSNNLDPKQGFIIPDGVGTLDNLYIHFHSGNPSISNLCTLNPGQGLCAATTALSKNNIRAGIILSMEKDGQTLTKPERDCILAEATEKIANEVVLKVQGYTATAEGSGSNQIISLLEQGYKVNKTILFGACENDNCEKITKFEESGSILIYALDKELPQVKTLLVTNSSKIFALSVPTVINSQVIPSLCYLDHITGNKCNGKAQGIVIPLAVKYGIGESCTDTVTEANCKNKLDCEDSSIDGPDNFCVCNDNQQCADAYGDPNHPTETWECINGGSESFGLNYCKSNTNKILYPIQQKDVFKPEADSASLLSDLSRGYSQTPLTEEQLLLLIQKPKPKIRIPGLSFTDLTINGSLTSNDDGSTYLEVPYLGEYLGAVYNYLILIAGVVCVARIIMAGFIYTAPDSSGEAKSSAIKMIQNAVLGLLLAVGSYTILYLFNPALVEFKNLKILYSREQPYFEPAELPQTAGGGYVVGTAEVSAEAGKTIGALVGGPNTLPACSPQAAQTAAKTLNDRKICVGPVHCAYTATRFLQYIGCSSKTLTGNANYMVGNLEQEGWVSLEITPENASNLPVGALWFPGHAGVSTANGTMFESTIAGAFNWASDKKGCPPLSGNASQANCGYCAQLSGQEPWQQNEFYKKGQGNNQGWKTSGTGNIKQFRLVIYPAAANVTRPPLGCCTFSGGKKNLASKLFCQQIHIKKSGSGKITSNDWSETLWDKLKNTPQTCPTK